MANDKIKGLHIDRNGYGRIPKSVMQDQNLSISTKAVYAYFCSFTGSGDSCFPTRKKICFDLSISNDSLSKYLNQLIDNGYLIVEQEKENGRFANNVYTLPDTISPCPKISDTGETEYGKTDTKKNSSKTNSNNKNNSEEKKKERKKSGYDEILSQIEDDSLKECYLDYIKMRQMIKAPMTDRALTMLINKVNELEPNSVDRQKKMLETAIMNNWKSVYPLKDNAQPRYGRKEPVPGWMEPTLGNAELEAIQRVLKDDVPTLGNDPELAERAEKLRQKLQGD